MDSIQEQLLFTTLRIECFDSSNRLYSMGTGFLLQRPVDKDKCKIYLVTNKHVLKDAEAIRVTFTKNRDESPDIGNTLSIPISDSKKYIAKCVYGKACSLRRNRQRIRKIPLKSLISEGFWSE